jgi:hypothetical protein
MDTDIDKCINIHMKIINGDIKIISYINKKISLSTPLTYLYNNMCIELFDDKNITLIELFHEYTK